MLRALRSLIQAASSVIHLQVMVWCERHQLPHPARGFCPGCNEERWARMEAGEETNPAIKSNRKAWPLDKWPEPGDPARPPDPDGLSRALRMKRRT